MRQKYVSALAQNVHRDRKPHRRVMQIRLQLPAWSFGDFCHLRGNIRQLGHLRTGAVGVHLRHALALPRDRLQQQLHRGGTASLPFSQSTKRLGRLLCHEVEIAGKCIWPKSRG